MTPGLPVGAKLITSASTDSLLRPVLEQSESDVHLGLPTTPKPLLPTAQKPEGDPTSNKPPINNKPTPPETPLQFMNELEKWQNSLEKEEKIFEEKFLKAQKREELLEDWTRKMDAFEKKFFSSLSEEKHIQDFSTQLEEHQKEIEHFKEQFKAKADKKESYWAIPIDNGEYETYNVNSHKQKIKQLYLAQRQLPSSMLPLQTLSKSYIPDSPPLGSPKKPLQPSSDEESSDKYESFEETGWENEDLPED
jgi:hypothetical protein